MWSECWPESGSADTLFFAPNSNRVTWGRWCTLPTTRVSTFPNPPPSPRPLDGSSGLAHGMIVPRLFRTRPTFPVASISGSLTWRRLCRNLIHYIFTFRFLSLFNPYSLTSGFYSPSSSVITVLLWAQLIAARSTPSSSRACRQRLCWIWFLGIACRPLAAYSYTYVSAKINFVAILLGGFHSNGFVPITRKFEIFALLTASRIFLLNWSFWHAKLRRLWQFMCSGWFVGIL